jgi:fatty acid desaturase
MARQTQEVTGMGATLGRALVVGVMIVAVQWAVVSFTTDPRAWGVVLGVPALFAGSALARMFTVTDLVRDPGAGRRGWRR